MSAHGADVRDTNLTCADVREQYQLTAAALAELQDFIGSCERVVEIDGSLFIATTAVVRSASSRMVRLYLPSTDHTFEVRPDRNQRVNLGGRLVRPMDLQLGQQLQIHFSVDGFGEPIPVAAVYMATEPSAVEPESVPEPALLPATPVATLPTTASPLPLFLIAGFLLLGVGLLIRGLNRA